jgi:hypothetical protein
VLHCCSEYVIPKEGPGTARDEGIPADVLERMVPNESALALSRTSKKMRAAAHAASVDLVVEARPGHKFSNGQGLLAELNGFSPSWTVTVLRLRDCNLRVRGGATLAFFLEGNTTLTELDVGSNSLQEPGGLAMGGTAGADDRSSEGAAGSSG